MRNLSWSIVYIMLSIALAAFAVENASSLMHRIVYADTCTSIANGCYDDPEDTFIPCTSTTTCTFMSGLNSQIDPNCPTSQLTCYLNNVAANWYQATAVTSWISCYSVSDSNAPACNEQCNTCLNVDLYVFDCSSSLNKCSSTTMSVCGAPSSAKNCNNL